MTATVRRLALSSQPIGMRFYAEVACGWPSPAADYEEAPLSLDELVNITAYSTFLVRARGESMHPLIGDGDVLVVEKGKSAKLGSVVVAILNGDFTVKRLGKVDNRDALIPDNSDMAPIMITDGEPIEVWGVVRWILRSLE
ncbi:LexA family protein [Pseudomonas tritici]|uniref:LexA family protein n=1 Tax=Pseudomonas tritici TaxID=2745518 RepID=UPI00387AA9D9